MIKPTLDRFCLYLCCTLIAQWLFFARLNSQTVIGGDTIDQSAVLDIQDTARGVLLPRLTTVQRNAIVKPATGLLILNTTKQCLETNIGSPDVPNWKCITTGIAVISEADTAYWNRKLGAGDTVALSNRINAKLSPNDTVALSNRIDAKLSSFTEGDPVFNTSVAKGITAADTVYWNRKLEPKDTVSLSSRVNTKLNPYDTLSLSDRIDNIFGLPTSGNSPGDILFWDGSSWVRLSSGQNGQLLLFNNGLPTWAGVASLTTNAATSITGTTATLGGNITSDGGSMITARGVVYSTTPNPLIGNSILSMGTGSGSFAATIQGLLPNTTYYVRAFATNSIGTAYGNEVSFTSPVNLPTISTNAVTNISNNSAIGGGNITADGGSEVTVRGLVYGTSPTPTLSNSVLNLGSGTGTFSGTITGLSPNTTYYVRAFATNSAGTSYGNEVSFTKLCGAYVASGVWKNFMCHNLGAANPSADPFTPSWEINGGYWQWGWKEMAAPGPSGPGENQANAGSISGWNYDVATNGSWSDAVKTVNDPCPAGFRVPTRNQWEGVINNNAVSNVGSSWTSSNTNYTTGKRFGELLFLPAAGYREKLIDGALLFRGSLGYYWSSPEVGANSAWRLDFTSSASSTYYSDRTNGFSIRCIAE